MKFSLTQRFESRFALAAVALLILSQAGCNSSTPLDSGPLSGGSELRELTAIEDLNPAPRIVEVELTAAATTCEFAPGIETEIWAYNGSLPGPLIEASVGDEIIVHFKNELPEETTVHWHGIRLPADMDGTHFSQEPVPPGGSFEYRFTVPDAGTFWYHPHHRSSHQVPMGLYGVLLVRGDNEPQFSRERVLVLSDIELDRTWQNIPLNETITDQFDLALGPEGNTMLVNGQQQPTATLAPGSRERWRILNACASRYFNLGLAGQGMTLIGADNGLIDAPREIESLLIAPAERYEIVVSAPAEAGSSTELRNLAYQRLHGYAYEPQGQLALVRVSYSGKAVETPPVPAQLAVIEEPAEPVRTRGMQLTAQIYPPLGEILGGDPHDGGHGGSGEEEEEPGEEPEEEEPGHGGHSGHGVSGHEPGHHDHGPQLPDDVIADFRINGRLFPDVPVFTAELGTTEIWAINNHTEMDHPMHIHGFRFQVLDVNGVAPPYRCWKDTVNVPGSVRGDVTVRLLVDYSGFPGRWMYHCHILHHQEMGMMGELAVE